MEKITISTGHPDAGRVYAEAYDAALEREAALREEIEMAKKVQETTDAIVTMVDGQRDHWIEKCGLLKQRLTVAERDARRYRYLREGAVMHYMSAEGSESKDAYLTITGYGHDDSAESIDNAIDAQILAALKPAAEVIINEGR